MIFLLYLLPTHVDFGLPGLRYSEGERGGEGEERKSVIPKVYRAPEVRDLLPSQVASTTSADVYRSVRGYW